MQSVPTTFTTPVSAITAKPTALDFPVDIGTVIARATTTQGDKVSEVWPRMNGDKEDLSLDISYR